MYKKKQLLIFVFIFFLMTLPSYASNDNSFKVVGYCSESFDDPVESIQYSNLSHIIYAFIIPQSDGTLLPPEKPEKLKSLVRLAHKNNVKVCIAIGGWSYKNIPLNTTFESLAASTEARSKLTTQTLDLIEQYQLDGLELDWEYPTTGTSATHYELLVTELGRALAEKNKTLSAAVGGALTSQIASSSNRAVSDKCLKTFTWINIMAYDMGNANHAPYWFAENSIQYWLNRGVPKQKIVLGIPLYARPSWKQYRHLVAENPQNAFKDYASGTPLKSWYNGISTCKEKTRLALNLAGGVMLFDINEDTLDSTSILTAVNTVKTEALTDHSRFTQKVYCHINSTELNFEPQDNLGAPFIDQNGRILVPFRKPLEFIGATVNYDSSQKTATAQINNQILKVPLNNRTIELNGSPVVMDTESIIKDGRLYIPLRYVFESFGYTVEWHPYTRTAHITQ